MNTVNAIRVWFALNYWFLRERYRRLARVGAYQFEAGTYAVITFGPSAGRVVRLVRCFFMPPGCRGCAVHRLQPYGPVWSVDRPLEWQVWSASQRREVTLRLHVAPWTALRALSAPPETPSPDLSDMDGFHRAVGSGQLADMLYRLAGANVLPFKPRGSGSDGEGGLGEGS
jgi:hypothetical protein